MKEPHAPPQKKKGKRWREEGNVSWMRLCQSVTASADIALFVGRRGREREGGEEKGFVDGGGAKVKEKEVSRGTCTSGARRS